MRSVKILIPAAGLSRRMGGRDKLLEPVEGEAILRRQVRRATATGAEAVVTLPKGAAGPRAEQLEGLSGFRVAYIDASEGMAASLRAGAKVAAAARSAGLMVVLPDMPEIETEDIAALIAAFGDAPEVCLRATAANGTPGHPVIFAARLYPTLAQVQGDRGGRDILAKETVRRVPLDGQRAVTDLDTPEDWAAWRSRGDPA